MGDNRIRHYHHGRFKVFGGVLPDAVMAYQTYGDVSNPCIVFPTCYGAKLALGSESWEEAHGGVPARALADRNLHVLEGQLYLVGENKVSMYGAPLTDGSRARYVKKPWPANFRRALKALDPSQFFVVTFALFCNGEVRG